ncbi:unnamed protein product [Ceratitis capitata]|uniref:(Mediterranean fruit fly) hypothetical protein n=1 Tax=Ceratitis capitata TaxID=7213 RepID=A0A811U3N4_CERCA|nr:unnamed protein product [Ceratitis capitata]
MIGGICLLDPPAMRLPAYCTPHILCDQVERVNAFAALPRHATVRCVVQLSVGRLANSLQGSSFECIHKKQPTVRIASRSTSKPNANDSNSCRAGGAGFSEVGGGNNL